LTDDPQHDAFAIPAKGPICRRGYLNGILSVELFDRRCAFNVSKRLATTGWYGEAEYRDASNYGDSQTSHGALLD
jgi:hypothetical protein